MMQKDRRDFLKTVAAAGAIAGVGGTAGCVGSLTGGSSDSSVVRKIPAETDGLLWMDIDSVLDDEAVREVVNAILEAQSESEFYSGPENYDEALQQWNEETELDTEAMQELVSFAEQSAIEEGDVEEFSGAIIKAGWSEDDVVTSLEEDSTTEYEETEIAGKTVYEPQSEGPDASWTAVLSSNVYASADSEDHLETVIEAWTGDGDRLDSELRSAFDGPTDGPIKFVWRFPTDQLSEGMGGGEVDYSQLTSVNVLATTVYRDGDVRGLENRFKTDSEEDASEVVDVLEASRSSNEASVPEDQQDRLANVEIEQDGSDAVVTYETNVDDWVELVELFTQTTGGMSGGGGGGMGASTPQVAWDFEFDGTDVTVTHAGGDSITRENTAELRIGEQGVAMESWPLPVVAGDSRTMPRGDGWESDEPAAVIWEGPDGSSAILGIYRIP